MLGNGSQTKRRGVDVLQCYWHFVEHMLFDWKARECQLEVQCARCLVVRETPASMHKCAKCNQEKKISDVSPYAAQDWLGQQVEKSRYHCMDCVLPECFKCKTRAPFPKNYVKVLGEDGEYHDCCQKCCASDLRVCSRCHTQKTYGDFRKLTRGTHCTICKTCDRPPCFNCGTAYPEGLPLLTF